jgi:hypothetical protein
MHMGVGKSLGGRKGGRKGRREHTGITGSGVCITFVHVANYTNTDIMEQMKIRVA